MKTKWMLLATLALTLSPALALAAPDKQVQSNGTHAAHGAQYHDRTPRVPTRSAAMPR
jgi:hypothetical protein